VAESITESPAQMLMLLPALTFGGVDTVTVTWAVLEHPPFKVPVTVYVCVEVGTNGTPFCTPLLQTYVVAP